MNSLKSSIRTGLWGGILCLAALGTSCKNDDIPSESYYTFTGQTVRDYLNTEENYSIYNEFLNRSNETAESDGLNVPSLLSAYGYYTVFAPTNEAMTQYLEEAFSCSSLDELYETLGTHSADSVVTLVTRMHIISSGNNATIYESQNFQQKLPDRNLYDKMMYITTLGDTYLVNDSSMIVQRDVELHNGVLHGVDRVIEPSDMKLEDFFDLYPEYSLFGHLMDYVGLTESGRILTEPEADYIPDTRNYEAYKGAAATIEVPTSKKQFYTCFIESNEVLSRDIPQMQGAATLQDSIDAVKAYALEWYEREFNDATEAERSAAINENWTEPENYLNRFVAYHFLNMKVDRADFTRYNVAMANGYNRIKEFYESLAPNQEIYLSAGSNGHPWTADGESFTDPSPDGAVILNPNPESEDIIYNTSRDWGRPVRYVAAVGSRTITTENGFFHDLQNVLYYPRHDFKRIRFRHDISGTFFPEIMSNDLRYKYMSTGYIVLPQQPYQYASNIHFISSETIQIQTSPNTNSGIGSWNSNLGDEMMFSGPYDFVLRLPPVPAGTWEVRLGYVSADDRGCAQFFLGSEENCSWEKKDFSGLQPTGIPIDLTVSFLAQMGRTEAEAADGTKSEEEIHALDKEWYINGRMKGTNNMLGANGNDTRTLREILSGHNPSRRVIGRITLREDGSIYMRARSLTDEEGVRLGIDYIEICPDNVYDNPQYSEPRD